MEQAKKPWLLLVLSALVLHLSGASSEAVSTGEEESPWLWVSSESRAPQSEAGEHVIEVVDYVEDRHALASHADPRSEPRFIGNLKRKLCRVGLGLGERYEFCKQEDSTESNRVKRSPQFLRVPNDEVSHQDQNVNTRGQSSTRLFGSGFDGLLNPFVSPSFGVHFGGYPFGGGGYGGGYYGGGGNPFSFNLGPLSFNPFGGLKFSLHNGRPHIRPTLDLLITPNNRPNNYDYPPYPGYGYPNRFTRDVSHPLIHAQRPKKHSLLPTAFKPSIRLPNTFTPTPHKTTDHVHHHTVYFPASNQPHYQKKYPLNTGIRHTSLALQNSAFPPLLGFAGKSNLGSDSIREDRDDVFRKSES